MKKYKYIFSDLDGTLYKIYPEPLNDLYSESLTKFMSEKGYNGQEKSDLIISAFNVMKNSCTPDKFIGEIFFEYLATHSEIAINEWKELLQEYYSTGYDYCKMVSEDSPTMQKVINLLHEKGYKIFLTTNPLYSLQSLLKRLEWSGIPKEIFEDVTCFERYHYTKPYKEYFSEIISKHNLNPDEVLMLGNDTTDDTQCEKIGIDCYIVTDNLINAGNGEISTKYHGTSLELLKMIETEF